MTPKRWRVRSRLDEVAACARVSALPMEVLERIVLLVAAAEVAMKLRLSIAVLVLLTKGKSTAGWRRWSRNVTLSKTGRGVIHDIADLE